MKRLALLLVFATLPTMAKDKAEDFQRDLSEKIEGVQDALDQSNEDSAEWALKSVFIRTQVSGGFEVPLLTKFEVVPEIELIWQKK